MKNSLIRSTLFVSIASVVLSSCAFLQKSEFAERKYYNFPRTNHSVDPKQDETASLKDENAIPSIAIASEQKIRGNSPVITASADKKEVIIAKNILPAVRIYKQLPSIKPVQNNTADVPVISEKRSDALEFAKKKAFNPFSGSDASFLIQILAAIFLPPIGVYLHDNGRTGTWFWVTMLLCLAAICGFAFIDFGLVGPGFWFIAAIIALLVVFDVL
jgi:uncharacterized membrane protein YqaE (UPF0057 family)